MNGETTGDVRVNATLARLDELAEAPLTGHPEIFEDVHRRLQDALAGIEDGGPRPAEPGDAYRAPVTGGGAPDGPWAGPAGEETA